MKLSKAAKARIARMTKSEISSLRKAAILLADAEVITDKRYKAIMRTFPRGSGR